MYACYYGNENLVDRIVDLDQTTLFATNNDKQTPLMISTMSGDISIVKKTFHVSKHFKNDFYGLKLRWQVQHFYNSKLVQNIKNYVWKGLYFTKIEYK